MPNAFGFEQYPQRPSPDPRRVGQQLMQPQDVGMGSMGAGGMGQPGMGMMEEENPAALNVAQDEAAVRTDGQGPTQSGLGPTEATIRQLRQLGLSDMEIQMLIRSGGVR